MHIVILKADENGRIIMTEDEIRNIIKDAYNAGYAEGVKSVKNDESITCPYSKTLPDGSSAWRITCT